MKIIATKLAVTTTVKTVEKKEYEIDTTSITQIFDEVRLLWKEGFHIIKVQINESDNLVFDCAEGGRNVFGRISK